MLTTVLLAIATFFAGQQLAPVEIRNVPVAVNVPVPVPCLEKVPDRPAMPTETYTAKPAVDRLAADALAEIEIREGYETELRQVAQTCTQPINHSETHGQSQTAAVGPPAR